MSPVETKSFAGRSQFCTYYNAWYVIQYRTRATLHRTFDCVCTYYDAWYVIQYRTRATLHRTFDCAHTERFARAILIIDGFIIDGS